MQMDPDFVVELSASIELSPGGCGMWFYKGMVMLSERPNVTFIILQLARSIAS